MSQFILAWDNSLLLSNSNVTGQRALYKRRSDTDFLSTGFTPSNDLAKTVNQVDSPVLSSNIAYQFKIQTLCTTNGPVDNSDGIKEIIYFDCITPSITNTDVQSTIVLDVTNTDITKARFTLKKQSDNTVVSTASIVAKSGTTITKVATSLTANTAYYWEIELYATINNIEVISSANEYLGSVCRTNTTTQQSQSSCNAVVSNLVISSITSDGTATATWTGSGSGLIGYQYKVDNGSWTSISNNTVNLTGLSTGTHILYVKGMCNTGEGNTIQSDIVIPTPTCTATVDTVSITNTNSNGTATLAWTGTGAASYEYKIDNGSWIVGTSPISLTSLAAGSHTAYVRPKCSNQLYGNTNHADFTIPAVQVCNAPTNVVVTIVDTLIASWGWTSNNPYVDDTTAPSFTVQGTQNLTTGDNIVADLHTMPSQYYAILKYPATESSKTIWNDSGSVFNNGQIPDSAFRAIFTVNGYKYIVSRTALDFDTQTNSRVTFS